MNNPREQGAALFLVIFMVTGFMVLTAISLDMTLNHARSNDAHAQVFTARQIAQSGAAQAIALVKDGGFTEPVSGGGASPAWVDFSNGQFIYYTDFDDLDNTTTIRAWGRVAVDKNTSGSIVPPDSVGWDSKGWLVQGIEISLVSRMYIPETPIFFGNGGIEKPLGGFDWTSDTDPADPDTWTVVTDESSFQDSDVPFQVSALDHPGDHLYSGVPPTPAVFGDIHEYALWVSQNPIGQANTEAWFANSAGGGDPKANLFPAPNSDYYDMSNPNSPGYPFAIDPSAPDVQTFAHKLWQRYGKDAGINNLGGGSISGTFGDFDNPEVTIVTGKLDVPSGKTLEGAGVLLIRDDYDPNTDTDNRPDDKASLFVSGTFKWTGLVIVAGWAPTIEVRDGGDATILGTLMGEDSVQSGGEISLDSATIILKVRDKMRILYSRSLFEPGGMVNGIMPRLTRDVVGIRSLN